MRRPGTIRLLLAGALLAGATALPLAGWAQDKKPEEKEEGPPPISEVVKDKDMVQREGFIKLWVDEKKDELYGEIPSSLIGKDFLIASSFSSGQYAGLQTNDLLLRFEKRGDELLLVKPNVFFTAEGELKEVVQYTYPDQVLAKTPIMGKGGSGEALIDLKQLLASQTKQFIGGMAPAVFTQIGKAKSFENNTVVELQFRGEYGVTGVYFNIGELPETGYQPRVADSRIGYFLTAKTDFSKDARSDTTFDRYINRWQLEKQDKTLSLSPPKEPIVIYLEHTVPVRYRRWVREGIESWNKAFEKIGIVDAIEVRQQTKTNDFKDLDPEDSRYNFFRWIASQRPFAIAPSRVDPRTGQVLDSDILFDESMVRFYIQDFQLFVNSIPETKDLSPRMRHWLARNPSEHPNWNDVAVQYSMMIESDPSLADKTPEQLFAEDLMGNSYANHQNFCSIGHELSRELAFANLGLEFSLWQSLNATEGGDGDDGGEGDGAEDDKKDDKKKSELDEWPEEFIGPIVREIVAHEFGHTLGLRHNFKGSSWKSYDEIVKQTDKSAPTSGSVMDYNAFTLKGDGTRPDVWVTPTIGPYDEWAIEYGYAIPGSHDYDADEKKMLASILDRVAEVGNDYGTDEDVASPDPLITRWDMGKDSLAFFKSRVDLSDKILANLLDVIVDDDESYAKARQAYEILLAQRFVAAYSATKYVGGYSLHRDHKDDPNARPPIQVVSAKEQRNAMKLIVDSLFAEDAFKIDPKIQNYLAASRWTHEGSYDWYEPLTFPIQDQIMRFQSRVLFMLTTPERMQYLYNAEYNVDAKTDLFTLPEMMQEMQDSIWTEVIQKKVGGKSTTRKPAIDNLRRNLQRQYLSRLIAIANSGETSMYPPVARTLAWKQMKDIGEAIDNVLKDGKASDSMDPYTAAHLEESRTRIEQALNAQFTIGGNAPRFTIIYNINGEDTPGATTPTGKSYLPRPGSF